MSDVARKRPLCVKVCGITRAEDADAAIEAGADLLGFNFHAPSPRYVTVEGAAAIIARLPRHVLAVGIMVDPRPDDVRRVIETAGVALLQFHGDESAEFCRSFPVPVMKALRLQRLGDLADAASAHPDGWILADAADPTRHGGTGRTLSLEPIDASLARRLFMAGGLRPDNVGEVVRAVRPLGVDVCSGIESRPGAKDHARLRSFVSNAKTA